MFAENRRLFNLIFLVVFFTVTATINVCHTETGIGFDPTCPACNFQNSCLATAVIHFFQLPVISPVEIVHYLEVSNYVNEVVQNFPSRSPPKI
jgi:hypothetical protein